MTDAAPASATHLSGYMDGAVADAAAQKLIDGGLFADILPKAAPATPPVAPTEAKEPVEQPKAETAEATAEPAEQPAEQSENYADLDDFLAKGQYDREAFLSLPAKVKVDGKESTVPIAALIKSYQTDAYVTQRSQAQAEKEKAFEAERSQAIQTLQGNLKVAEQVTALAHQELMREYKDVTPEDPARYLAAQQRLSAIQQHIQSLRSAQDQVNAQAIATERERMLSAVPEWRDAEKFKEAASSIAKYAASRGFTPAELSTVIDHRHTLVLRDAAMVPALQARVAELEAKLTGKTSAALKVVRSAPPMAAPGARIMSDPRTARLQQARTAIRSGKIARNESAQLAAAEALLQAGV